MNLAPRGSLRKPLPAVPRDARRRQPSPSAAFPEAQEEPDLVPSPAYISSQSSSSHNDTYPDEKEPADAVCARDREARVASNQLEAIATLEQDDRSEKQRIHDLRANQAQVEDDQPIPPRASFESMLPLSDSKEPRCDDPVPSYSPMDEAYLYPLTEEKAPPSQAVPVARKHARGGYVRSPTRPSVVQPARTNASPIVVPGGLTRLSTMTEGVMPSLRATAGANEPSTRNELGSGLLPFEFLHLSATSPVAPKPTPPVSASAFYRGGAQASGRQWLDAQWELGIARSSQERISQSVSSESAPSQEAFRSPPTVRPPQPPALPSPLDFPQSMPPVLYAQQSSAPPPTPLPYAVHPIAGPPLPPPLPFVPTSSFSYPSTLPTTWYPGSSHSPAVRSTMRTSLHLPLSASPATSPPPNPVSSPLRGSQLVASPEPLAEPTPTVGRKQSFFARIKRKTTMSTVQKQQ